MVEDTEAHQQLMTRMLTRMGIEHISIVSTASEFLETLDLKGHDFNALIVDAYLGTGQMNGLTAIENARQKGHEQPALMLTTDTQGIDIVNCYTMGVIELLDKDRIYTDGVFDQSIRNLNDRVVSEYLAKSQALLVPVIGEEIQYVPAGDILYIHFDDRTCRIVSYLTEYVSTVSLKTYIKLLEPYGFALVNKPTLANMSRVERFDSSSQSIAFYHDPQERTIDVSARRVSEVKRLLKNNK